MLNPVKVSNTSSGKQNTLLIERSKTDCFNFSLVVYAVNTNFQPLVGEGGRGMLTGVDVLASPCAPSPVSAIRTPELPLLPQGEKGVGEMRAKGARECRTSLISPKNSLLNEAGG